MAIIFTAGAELLEFSASILPGAENSPSENRRAVYRLQEQELGHCLQAERGMIRKKISHIEDGANPDVLGQV